MAKLVDPRDKKYEYQSPIERYGCPLERDAQRKRWPPRHEFQMHTDVLCSPPTPGTRQAVFSLKLDTVVKLDEKGANYEWGIALTPKPVVDISMERTGKRPFFMILCRDGDGNVRELKLEPGMMVQLDASQAAALLVAKERLSEDGAKALFALPERLDELGVFITGPGVVCKAGIIRAASMGDCQKHAQDENVRFFLAESDAFYCEKIKWISTRGP